MSHSKKTIYLLPTILVISCFGSVFANEQETPVLKNSPSLPIKAESKPRTLTSIGFLGFVKHAKATPLTHEGNMDYISIGRTEHYKNLDFENGIGTYMDSYHKRSYTLFSNISNSKIRSKYIQPVIGLNCSFKGVDYKSDKRKWKCSPPLKIRAGSQEGLFAYITPVPKIGKLTNGLLVTEVGLRF